MDQIGILSFHNVNCILILRNKSDHCITQNFDIRYTCGYWLYNISIVNFSNNKALEVLVIMLYLVFIGFSFLFLHSLEKLVAVLKREKIITTITELKQQYLYFVAFINLFIIQCFITACYVFYKQN